MKRTSEILLCFYLASFTVAIPRPLQNPAYIGYQDSLGQYSFGYSSPESARSEVRQSNGQTRGFYSYVDGDGIIQSAKYIADGERGFQITATNLPQAVEDTPEVRAAREAHLKEVRLAYEREQREQHVLGQQQLRQQQLIQQELLQQQLVHQQLAKQQLGQQQLGQQSRHQIWEQLGSNQQLDQELIEQGINQQEIGQIEQQSLCQQENGQQIFVQQEIGQKQFVQDVGQQQSIWRQDFSQDIGQQQFGQDLRQQAWGQQSLEQRSGTVGVEPKKRREESVTSKENKAEVPITKIVGQIHENVAIQEPEILQNPEANAARRSYIEAVSAARAKAEGAKIRNLVKDVVTKVSQKLGPIEEATITDENGVVVQYMGQNRSSGKENQISSLPLLKHQGQSQSSVITPASPTLLMKNQTFPSTGFMGQANLKDKQSTPDAGDQLYRLATPSHNSKPTSVPSTIINLKYSSDVGMPLQPSFAVQCFITRADQLGSLVDVN